MQKEGGVLNSFCETLSQTPDATVYQNCTAPGTTSEIQSMIYLLGVGEHLVQEGFCFAFSNPELKRCRMASTNGANQRYGT